MRLRTKMLAVLAIPVVILIGALSFYAYFTAKNALQAQILRTARYETTSNGDALYRMLLKGETTVNEVSAVLAGRALTKAELGPFIKAVKGSDPDILNILVALEDQTYIDSNGWVPAADYDPRRRPWYQKIIKTNGVAYSDVYLDQSTNQQQITLGKAIVVNGKPVGVVGFDVNLTKMLEMVKGMTTGRTGYAFVLDDKGHFVSHPQFQMTDRIQTVYDGALAGFYQRVLNQRRAESIIVVNGVERLYEAAPIGNVGWTICTTAATSELYGAVNRMALFLTIGGVVSLLLTAGLIFYITLNISGNMKRMTVFAGQLAAGDFREHARAIVSKDEIGQLADSLADMRTTLRRLIEKIVDSAERLAASSQELTASADQSAKASVQVADSIASVAKGADDEREAMNRSAAAVEQMAVGLSELENTMETVAAHSSQAAQKAADGNSVVEKAVRQMGNIEQTVGNTARVVADLGERSKEIGQIIETISGIAGQTNLLALNAAIEAARAGEQGKGFAVVAEEVRKLAEQSEEAAHRIAELIGVIRAETDRAVQAMQSGTKEVAVGAQVVNDAGKFFGEINDMVTKVNARIDAARGGMRSLAGGTDEIVASIQVVNNIGQKTAADTETVSAATQQQSASMEEMAAASRELAELAGELQSEVAKFRT